MNTVQVHPTDLFLNLLSFSLLPFFFNSPFPIFTLVDICNLSSFCLHIIFPFIGDIRIIYMTYLYSRSGLLRWALDSVNLILKLDKFFFRKTELEHLLFFQKSITDLVKYFCVKTYAEPNHSTLGFSPPRWPPIT